jgi:predicted XRE-type DNA-binding protein
MKNKIDNQIIVYDNGEIELKVSIDNNKETIWLTQKQIAELFDVKVPAISKHIKNIFNQNELIESMVVSKMEITTQHGAINNKTQSKIINIYNLDIILAIGYRVNSLKAIHFRQWATKVLKEYILNGYAINTHKITEQRLLNLENDMQIVKSKITNDEVEIKQGIFYNGQIFDAYIFINNLLKSAKKEVILVDNYIDDTVLTLFSKYSDILFTIITQKISKQLQLDIDKYNKQYKNLVVKKSDKYHDRFLIIDDEVYHIGASLKDLGNKVFAFSKMDKQLLDGIV